MWDKYNNLDYKHDDHGDMLLNGSDDQKEPMEVADQKEGPTEDTLRFLMCGEREIFSQDSLMDSQLVAVVNASTPMDPVVSPARDPETEDALEPSPPFSW